MQMSLPDFVRLQCYTHEPCKIVSVVAGTWCWAELSVGSGHLDTGSVFVLFLDIFIWICSNEEAVWQSTATSLTARWLDGSKFSLGTVNSAVRRKPKNPTQHAAHIIALFMSSWVERKTFESVTSMKAWPVLVNSNLPLGWRFIVASMIFTLIVFVFFDTKTNCLEDVPVLDNPDGPGIARDTGVVTVGVPWLCGDPSTTRPYDVPILAGNSKWELVPSGKYAVCPISSWSQIVLRPSYRQKGTQSHINTHVYIYQHNPTPSPPLIQLLLDWHTRDKFISWTCYTLLKVYRTCKPTPSQRRKWYDPWDM